MRILGIETSCDETAAAVVCDARVVESNVILSQIAAHRPFGGVVPEIASRAHVEALPGVLKEALGQAGTSWEEIDALAVTYGPGLASSLLIGVSAAKALALRLGKPLIPVNHLHGHVHSIFLDPSAPDPRDPTPMLVLLVSGGHTALLHRAGPQQLTLLGQTIDDAAGEALDKAASLLGLGYPGGPAIESAAATGTVQPAWFPAPARLSGKSRTGRLPPDLCFSFSGLKTSLLTRLRNHPDTTNRIPDAAASFQEAVLINLIHRIEKALDQYPVQTLACVGGVAKNERLRDLLHDLAHARGIDLLHAPLSFCTDNAAMIAGAAGLTPTLPDPAANLALDIVPSLAVAGEGPRPDST